MSRDESNWAKKGTDLQVGDVPKGAINLNVQGRSVNSPIQGFGKMWQKTYRVNLGNDVEAAEVISTWKEKFPSFWPKGQNFYGPITGIAPGEVALLNLAMPGGVKLSTGVLVLYADEESFTLMTPQGHMFAGWITFSAFPSSDGVVAQTQVLIRASDPLYEIAFALGGQRKEDRFWDATLKSLATHFGVADPKVDVTAVVVDKKRQWKRARNIKQNAAIRSGMYAVGIGRRKARAAANAAAATSAAATIAEHSE
jgi:hypothetical protein